MTPHDLSNYVNGVDSYGYDATNIDPVRDIQDLKKKPLGCGFSIEALN